MNAAISEMTQNHNMESASRDADWVAGQAARLASASAEERVAFALSELPGPHVLSSSFGAQAAVSLHLVTRLAPDIPVIVIDTGYLFPETYRFIDDLSQRLGLNLSIYSSNESPSWHEARHGRLWEAGRDGIERYNRMRKVEPMQRALRELGAATWFAGLRRDQSATRAGIEPLEVRDGRFKVHPIYDWSDRDVGRYLSRHGLPYHPLWDAGYVSIGDWHSTKSLAEAGSVEGTRFSGLKRECGIHGLTD
jgi:phosphoadenosine phosphosulfate reductase